ncbi:4732_t:CDS:2, partial [Funneliformis geosporum]
ECKRFARRIVDNMNDTLTQLIRISPNDATKLKRVYSKPSVKYNRPIGVDEPQLPKGLTLAKHLPSRLQAYTKALVSISSCIL